MYMGMIIVLALIGVIGISVGAIIDKKKPHTVGCISSYIGSTVLIVVLAMVIVVFIQRDNNKEMIANYKVLQTTLLNAPEYSSFESVYEANKVIAKHALWHDSPWVGAFYSKEIAELEPILYAGETK